MRCFPRPIRASTRLALAHLLSSVVVLPAGAAPLSFGEFEAGRDLSASDQLAGCASEGVGFRCLLTRTDFGGLPIERSRVTLNADGRPVSVEITLDASDHDTAVRLLAGRYGRPGGTAEQPQWRGFDDDARISVDRAGRSALISFRFPANQSSTAIGRTATDPVLPLVAFVLLGLLTGIVIRRTRGRRLASAPVAAEPSMRATLERRLQRGDDLSF